MKYEDISDSVAESLSEEHFARWFNYCFFVRGRSQDEVNRIAKANEFQSRSDWLDAWDMIGEWLDWLFGVEKIDAEGGGPE
ncbi:hypothetical protein [Rhodopirellula bahusiensis]|uniref:Uncharacterized protein n=1 Tax=Rhodopirellula bahusiensis TaxID=2014065 RepID=A0A2G1W6D5_9BACT|nr:hypothetical protein [Rhodopirellula bahusiensis]PHQ34595.1 hypothetical protein CEE69_14370 [Rhodopirellula bahusiensis]